jgi:plasmid maintenance system antidote protein VapI
VACLAEAMGVKLKTLENFVHGSRNGSPGMALAAAGAAGRSVDALLGAPVDTSVCPTCGAKRGGSA